MFVCFNLRASASGLTSKRLYIYIYISVGFYFLMNMGFKVILDPGYIASESLERNSKFNLAVESNVFKIIWMQIVDWLL
jgi:hypothetical protein